MAVESSSSSRVDEGSRREIEAAIAGAAELRALHAALVQGNSPVHCKLLTSHDYPVFTPSHEDEPLPAYQQLQLVNKPFSDVCDGQSGLIETTTLRDESTFTADQVTRSVSRGQSSVGEVKSVNGIDSVSVSCSSNGNVSKSRGGVLSWRFPRLKKKPPKGESSSLGAEPVSVDRLKKEILEANLKRDEALAELAKMRPLFEDLRAKLEGVESHCEDLKRALRRAGDSIAPSSEGEIVEVYLQVVSEARLSVKHFCKILLKQIQETDARQMEKFKALLRAHNLSLSKKHSKSVLFHLEAVANRELYEDFENRAFRKNGAPMFLDPRQDRQAKRLAFTTMSKLGLNAVLDKGSKNHDEEFSRHCDRKMSCLITTLDWTGPWPDQLARSFLVAARWVWLVHLLAFSLDPPLTILRVDENRRFDPHYMEDMLVDKYGGQRGSSRVKVMVMPGFYVHDKIVRCKVLCRYKPILG